MDYSQYQDQSGIVQPKQRGIYSEMINPEVAQGHIVALLLLTLRKRRKTTTSAVRRTGR
jgi:hypothetical protein